MPQIFHPSMNTIARVSIFGVVFLLAGLVGMAAFVVRSPYITEQGVIRPQPVPFSHQHHVGDIGLDCRYCHQTVETEAFAGMPPTETCRDCHSQLWADSPMLAPVQESFRIDRPLEWTRVHDLPDYAFFHHGIHVSKGIACATCHGDVDEMPLMYRESTLHMKWCLDCHRNPEELVRPRDAVFEMQWQPDADTPDGIDLVKVHSIESQTNCSICHR